MVATAPINKAGNERAMAAVYFSMRNHAEVTDPQAVNEEQQFITQLQCGDEQAYALLVRQYSGQMLAVARRLLRNEKDARDAVQDAFISAFRALPGFRAEAKLSTWLHRIVTNAALMKMRSASRRPEVSLEPLLPTFDEEGRHTEPVELLPVTAEAALQSKETRAIVRACIEQLPAQYRAVIVLRDIEELDTAEAAEVLGITQNAVKIRLHRARQALMSLLRKVLSETPYTTKSIS